jgi:hypothetical protein
MRQLIIPLIVDRPRDRFGARLYAWHRFNSYHAFNAAASAMAPILTTSDYWPKTATNRRRIADTLDVPILFMLYLVAMPDISNMIQTLH